MTLPSHAIHHIRSTLLGAVLLTCALSLTARPAVGQVTTKLATTESVMDKVIGAGVLTVSHDSERPVELVLLAHRIEDERVVDTHRSRPFTVAAGRTVRLDERHLPAERFYGGTVTGEVVTTRDAVPLESVERVLNEKVLDGTGDGFWDNLKTFQEWKPRDGVVFVAVPADDRLRRVAKTYPVLAFIKRASR